MIKKTFITITSLALNQVFLNTLLNFFAIISTPNMAFFQRFNSFIEIINGFCFCNSPKVHQNSLFVWSDIIAGFGQPTIPSLFAMEVIQKNFAV